jgi:hypothetical protein
MKMSNLSHFAYVLRVERDVTVCLSYPQDWIPNILTIVSSDPKI